MVTGVPKRRKEEKVRGTNGTISSLAKLGLGEAALRKLQNAEVSSCNELTSKTETELLSFGLTARELASLKSRLALEGLSLSKPTSPSNQTETEVRGRGDGHDMLLVEPPVPVSIAEDEPVGELLEKVSYDFASREIFGTEIDLRPKAARRSQPTNGQGAKTDDERAKAKASTSSSTAPKQDPRIEELRNTRFMTVEDAAYVYGISRGSAYKACKNDQIPCKRFGKSYRVISQRVFAELDAPAAATADGASG